MTGPGWLRPVLPHLAAIGWALVGLAAAVGIGYALATHWTRPVTPLALLIVVVALGAIQLWLIAGNVATRDVAEKAADDADRALALAQDLKLHIEGAEAPAVGRHATKGIAR